MPKEKVFVLDIIVLLAFGIIISILGISLFASAHEVPTVSSKPVGLLFLASGMVILGNIPYMFTRYHLKRTFLRKMMEDEDGQERNRQNSNKEDTRGIQIKL